MARWMLKASEPSVFNCRPLMGDLGSVTGILGDAVSGPVGGCGVENQAILDRDKRVLEGFMSIIIVNCDLWRSTTEGFVAG